jgi:hypothetical protein
MRLIMLHLGAASARKIVANVSPVKSDGASDLFKGYLILAHPAFDGPRAYIHTSRQFDFRNISVFLLARVSIFLIHSRLVRRAHDPVELTSKN